MSQGNIEQAMRRTRYGVNRRLVLCWSLWAGKPLAGNHSRRAVPRWCASRPLGYTPAYQGPVDLFLRPWKWILAAVPASIRRYPYRYWNQPERSLHPISGAAAGVVQRMLTVVMHGDDAPQRGDRLYVVCNMRGCITATSVLKPAMRNCSRTKRLIG